MVARWLLVGHTLGTSAPIQPRGCLELLSTVFHPPPPAADTAIDEHFVQATAIPGGALAHRPRPGLAHRLLAMFRGGRGGVRSRTLGRRSSDLICLFRLWRHLYGSDSSRPQSVDLVRNVGANRRRLEREIEEAWLIHAQTSGLIEVT
jgi:hypothetical protein